MTDAAKHNRQAYHWPEGRGAGIVVGSFDNIRYEFGVPVHILVGRAGVVA